MTKPVVFLVIAVKDTKNWALELQEENGQFVPKHYYKDPHYDFEFELE